MTDLEPCFDQIERAVVHGRNERRARGDAAKRWGTLLHGCICGAAASRCH